MSRPLLLTAVGLMHNMVAAIHEGSQCGRNGSNGPLQKPTRRQERTEVLNTVVTHVVEVGFHRARNELVNRPATVADQLAKEKLSGRPCLEMPTRGFRSASLRWRRAAVPVQWFGTCPQMWHEAAQRWRAIRPSPEQPFAFALGIGVRFVDANQIVHPVQVLTVPHQKINIPRHGMPASLL